MNHVKADGFVITTFGTFWILSTTYFRVKSMAVHILYINCQLSVFLMLTELESEKAFVIPFKSIDINVDTENI